MRWVLERKALSGRSGLPVGSRASHGLKGSGGRRPIVPGLPACHLALAALLLPLLALNPAHAFEFQKGDLRGNLDTTLSYGLMWRVQDQDPDIIGVVNGGNAFSVNGDDGNLNYGKGLVNNVGKITSELGLNYRNFGLFVRGTGFYDFVAERSNTDRTPLSPEALDLVGSDVSLLDAFVYGKFNLGTMPGQIRVGDQVVSWGESTFIQNGINSINPVNVNAIRLPGSELKEALLPEGMVWGNLGLTENISVEAFYLYDYENTEIDPSGSFWSSNDFAGPGGEKVMLGFGTVADLGVTPALNTFLAVPQGADKDADDSGQHGLAFRVLAPGLNSTEFGFFYTKLHSRLPIVSARTGTVAGAVGAASIGAAAPSVLTAVGTHLALNPGDIPGAVAAGTTAGVVAGVPAGTAQAIAGTAATRGSAAGVAVAQAFATDTYAKTARYVIEYPEDVKLFGVSFNTLLTDSGVALQGEYSYRQDAPLQVDDIELLFAALGPINPNLANFNQVGNYTGRFQTDIPGFILRDMSQIQMTATKLFGPTLKAQQLVLVGEVGLTHVHSMPDKSKLRLDAAGTYVSGNAALASAHGSAANGYFEPGSAFADATSWGYRLVGRLDYNNAIGAVTLSPRIAWQHDVNGTTPGPGGNFIDGRKAVTLGLGADYQNRWGADLSYTNFFGAGRYNLINDRDIIAANIKYSF